MSWARSAVVRSLEASIDQRNVDRIQIRHSPQPHISPERGPNRRLIHRQNRHPHLSHAIPWFHPRKHDSGTKKSNRRPNAQHIQNHREQDPSRRHPTCGARTCSPMCRFTHAVTATLLPSSTDAAVVRSRAITRVPQPPANPLLQRVFLNTHASEIFRTPPWDAVHTASRNIPAIKRVTTVQIASVIPASQIPSHSPFRKCCSK